MLINRDYRRLWTGQLVSQTGDFVFSTTLALWIGTVVLAGRSYAPVAVSGLVVAVAVGTLLIGPPAGVFVDRWDRRRTMLGADLVRAGLVGALTVVAFLPAGTLPEGVVLGAVYATVFLATAAAQFFNPARFALIGEVVGPGERAKAAGIGQATQAIASIAGPPLAAPLLFTVGVRWALLVNALSFLASFAAVRGVRTAAERAADGEAPAVGGAGQPGAASGADADGVDGADAPGAVDAAGGAGVVDAAGGLDDAGVVDATGGAGVVDAAGGLDDAGAVDGAGGAGAVDGLDAVDGGPEAAEGALPVGTNAVAAPGGRGSAWHAEFTAGLRLVAGSRVLLALLVALVLATVGTGALNSLNVFFVTDNLGVASRWYGTLEMAEGVGLVGGAVIAAAMTERLGAHRVFAGGLALTGVGVIVYSRLTGIGPALVTLALCGVLLAALNTAVTPVLLSSVPQSHLGRVIAVINPVQQLAALVGVAASGWLASTALHGLDAHVAGVHFGPIDTIFTVSGLLVTAGGVHAAVAMRRPRTGTAAPGPEPEPEPAVDPAAS
ncbi:MAG: MFS transporter [Actinomycetia bacterium]|nr:MFS transporter [Actinomycetes bacterium]